MLKTAALKDHGEKTAALPSWKKTNGKRLKDHGDTEGMQREKDGGAKRSWEKTMALKTKGIDYPNWPVVAKRF